MTMQHLSGGSTGGPSGLSSRRVDTSAPIRPLVHIANLPSSTVERDLREVFGSLGQIQSAKVVASRTAGGLVYAFVEYVDVASAERAIRTMDGWLWFGTPIKVCWAKHSMHPDAVAETTADTERPVATHSNAGNSHLFVGDLSAEVDDGLLHSFFSRFASLADVRVMYDAETGKSRGFGFISFRSKHDAESCIATMQGQWLGGRQIRVNWANQKNNNQMISPPMAINTDQTSSNQQNTAFGARPTASGMTAFAPSTIDTTNSSRHPTLPRRHTDLDHINQSSTPTDLSSRQYNYSQILSAAPPSQTSVYVGNISPLTSESDLLRVFAPFNHGQPLEARIPPGRGYGFVTLASHEQAASAICTLSIQGVFMHSRWLKFGWQKDRHVLGGVGGAGGRMPMPTRSESAPAQALYKTSSSSSNEFRPF
ncbi:related to PUB1 - major polyadenylated RNA-binding protein of nucleus and cytoplasm [Ustilago trichophora]|uniref:Related to PUB1 - major polyadenylated RNA-binding protein of nucleus and cytoplasm n=1 Tax=Ustilago trichophora TaxID=86804 RepID=A0A5C3DTT6_9BASI|nr:related to PUB1 - major polyadenylated RNA-binding protein of nucleus and cytoplasm [Ustilago trichophora]